MIKQILVSVVGRSGGALATFLLTAIVANQFDQSDAGNFFLILTLLAVVRSSGLGGMDLIAVKKVAQYWGAKRYAMVAVVIRQVGFVAIVVAMFFCVSLFFSSDLLADNLWRKPSLAQLIKNASVIGFCYCLIFFVSNVLLAIGKNTQSVVIMTCLVPLGLGVGLYVFNVTEVNDAVDLLFKLSLSVCIASVAYCLICLPEKNIFKESNVESYAALLNSGFNLWLVGVLMVLSTRGVQLISARWLSSEDLSVLAVSAQLTMVASLVLVAINFVLAPRIANLHAKKDMAGLRSVVWTGVGITAIIALPIFIIIVFYSDALLSMIFGAVYASGSFVVLVLVTGQILNVLCGPISFLLSMTGYDRDLRNISLVTSLLTIFSALVLLPKFGLLGAAFTISIGTVLQNVSCLFLVRWRLGFYTIAIWKLWQRTP